MWMKNGRVIPVDRPGTVASSTAALVPQSNRGAHRRFHHHPHQHCVPAHLLLMGMLTPRSPPKDLFPTTGLCGSRPKAVHEIE